MVEIHLIQTGGTIDKDYPEGPGAYSFEIGEPAFKRITQRSAAENIHWSVDVVCRKDSQELDDVDRTAIYISCEHAQGDRIIVTHGTDTMLDTAAALIGLGSFKTIVLTGAVRPERFRDSDADFNFGMAVAAVQLCHPGVYIVMNGLIIPWEECTRDQDGNFVSTKK